MKKMTITCAIPDDYVPSEEELEEMNHEEKYTLSDWISLVRGEAFVDYDGGGDLVDKDNNILKSIIPSDYYRQNAAFWENGTHVIWYNK